MPPKTDSPTPSLRFHNGAWKIVWSLNGKQYSVSTGLPEKDKLFAEQRRVEFAIALTKSTPAFPREYAKAKSVLKYIETRYGSEYADLEQAEDIDPGKWLDEYVREITAECSAAWARDSIARLRKLEVAAKGFDAITPKAASQYLADIAAKKTTGTRNRALVTFSRFFKWAIRTGRATANPFAGIAQLPEPRRSDIIYCTPKERAEIIAFARDTGWPDWLAIPLAFYSGMRREEVSRLGWHDIRFGEGLLIVQKSKTGKSRIIPLAAALEEILSEVPEERRRGLVVVTPAGLARAPRLENLVRHIRRMKRAAFLSANAPSKPLPSRSKEYRDALAKWKEATKGQLVELDAALERIGWNPFRHTFGSLLAQAGVSIDKISAWMGNTPEVCRRHYAQFIPRDRRDSEIDKL